MPPEIVTLEPSGPVKSMFGETEFTVDPDGSTLVSLNGPTSDLEGAFADESFSANLSEHMTPTQRHALAQELMEFHRVDLESRENWSALSSRALVLLGIDKTDPSMLPFPGAASVQHPLLAEAVVQFQSNAIEEFFPATGPVKGKLAGKATPELEEQVERAQDWMNFYLTVEDEGYYEDCDQMLFYLPIAGSVFRKVWIDPRSQLPRSRYVKAEDFVAPYFARDLENCPRYAHDYQMTGQEIRQAQKRGEFIDVDLPQPSLEEPEEGSGRAIEDKADRRTRVMHETDYLYELSEYHIDLCLPAGVDEQLGGDPNLPAEEIEAPYIAVVDRTTGELLSLRRNWREGDVDRNKRIWFAHYKFFPGLGFYGWGFLHVIGSLADAVSGSVRALLDSALFATLQGGFRAKDGVKKAGSIALEPGKWKDIDAASEELEKSFFTPPFKEPSPALAQLMQSLVADGRRFASLTEVLVGQADNKAPVGTTLALIEQSMKLFTAIHKRIFNAAGHEYRMLGELFGEFSPYEEYPYALDGEEKLMLRSDFDDRVDFIPVADPNIISDVQRIALAQGVLELMKTDPSLYGPEERVEAHRSFLKALKVPDWERFAPKLPKASYIDPIGENALMMMGKPVRAYPGQRHDLHIQIHKNDVQIAQNTLPPDQFEQLYAVQMSHIREHMALWAQEQVSQSMQQSLGVPLPPTDIYGENEDQPPELEMAISMIAAQNLPPIPPPQEGSVAGAQQGTQQGGDDTQAKVDQINALTKAKVDGKDAETQAAIERDTARFAADQQRSRLDARRQRQEREQDHAQEMRHREEDHRLTMRAGDSEAAAKIIREHATARSKRAMERTAGESRLEMEVRREREKVKARGSAKPSGGKRGR